MWYIRQRHCENVISEIRRIEEVSLGERYVGHSFPFREKKIILTLGCLSSGQRVPSERTLLRKEQHSVWHPKNHALRQTAGNTGQDFCNYGEVSEWSNVPSWKGGVPKGTEGPNPSLSATKKSSLKDFFCYKPMR